MRHNRLLSPPRKRQRQCASSRQCGTRRLHAGLSFRRYLVACRHAGRMRIRYDTRFRESRCRNGGGGERRHHHATPIPGPVRRHARPVSSRREVVGPPVLQSLVDEQLLAQKAMADQLDKEPSVMRALERARRQILAHAAIEHAGGEIEISADGPGSSMPRIPTCLKSERSTFSVSSFWTQRVWTNR